MELTEERRVMIKDTFQRIYHTYTETNDAIGYERFIKVLYHGISRTQLAIPETEISSKDILNASILFGYCTSPETFLNITKSRYFSYLIYGIYKAAKDLGGVEEIIENDDLKTFLIDCLLVATYYWNVTKRYKAKQDDVNPQPETVIHVIKHLKKEFGFNNEIYEKAVALIWENGFFMDQLDESLKTRH